MKIFEPITINNVEIKNRIIMPGMETNLCLENGFISEDILKYYELRAKGGVGLIVVEGAYFDKKGRGTDHMISIEKRNRIQGLRKLANTIKKNGAKAALQIYHAGAQSTAFLSGEDIVAPSAVPTKTSGVMPKPLSKREIKGIVKGYAKASLRAKKAGFDGVEIHAGHGYLIGQFFAPLFNKRKDEYGGSLKNRARFALEVLRAVRKKCGDDFLIIFRLNCRDYIEGGLEVNKLAKIAKMLEENGVDLINITAGFFDSPLYPVVPYMNVPRGVYSEYSAIIKKELLKTPISVVGRINTPEIAEKILTEERADMVTIGRALIADPNFPKKIQEGNEEAINLCIGCNTCLNQIMIEEQVSCAVNPNLLGTNEDLPKTEQPQKVLIIGAGPAGLEAARVLHLRGHEVFVIDQREKIGGSLNLATVAPMRYEIKNLLEHYRYVVDDLGINIQLETPYNHKLLEKFQPEAVIIATGTTLKIPEIKSLDESDYLLYSDVLSGNVPSGKEIVVLGGGMRGIDVGDYLAEKGKSVTIIEETGSLGSDLYALVAQEIVPRIMDNENIKVILDTKIEEINGKQLIGKQKKEYFSTNFDHLVIATNPEPDCPFEAELKEKVSKVFKIGDCKKPRKIHEAVNEGYELGLNIESIKGLPKEGDAAETERDLRTIVVKKVQERTFTLEDIPDYLEVMVNICNTSEKIQKKARRLKLQFQFSIEDGPNYWIKIQNGQFTTGEGQVEDPDVTIEMQKAVAAGIFTGDVNTTAAYMRKQIKFQGSMRHGIKFQKWTNEVTKELGLD
ncbi:MAG: NAD(P)-binding protein [Candidatus Heimdallarchaeota archaeon]|nr:NAD(P)-binding protein [Candidatus Heimdallarchaeota archaeon]